MSEYVRCNFGHDDCMDADTGRRICDGGFDLPTVPYEQSRAYWVNVWAGQVLPAMLTEYLGDPCRGVDESRAAAEMLADEIFGKEEK